MNVEPDRTLPDEETQGPAEPRRARPAAGRGRAAAHADRAHDRAADRAETGRAGPTEDGSPTEDAGPTDDAARIDPGDAGPVDGGPDGRARPDSGRGGHAGPQRHGPAARTPGEPPPSSGRSAVASTPSGASAPSAESSAGPSGPSAATAPPEAGQSPASASPVLRPVGARRFWPRSFADRLTAPLPDVRALVRAAREGGMRPAPAALRGVAQLPYEPRPIPEARPGTVAATWVGHATWIVRIGGLTVLTDPVWSRRILGTPPRITPPGIAWEDLPPVDAVVVSHNHYDHLDAPTLRRLPRTTHLFVPAGLGRWCRRRGFTSVTELDWWEAAELPARDGDGRVRFEFVPAHHWSRRTLTDTCRSLWGGWVLSGPERGPESGPERRPEGSREPGRVPGRAPDEEPGHEAGRAPGREPGDEPGAAFESRGPGGGPDRQRVYFAGDTGYGHWFAEIGRRRPGIDLALLPIGAYEPRWMLKPVHTSPEEAVQACADVGARAMAPMHYATFLLSAEPPGEPLERVRAAWAAAGRDPEDLWDLPVGGSRVLES